MAGVADGPGEGVTLSFMADLCELADLCTPWCIHVVVTLRVAEHIEAGKSTIAEIA